ncbi:MAG: BglG family transcription antiterminator [Bacilli bacterium]|nr:BglG family transcription antiterminator [Bacilli bacterium]
MLDYKDNYLLNLLISSDYVLNISDIQKLLGVSQRSAYYSISKINDYLELEGLPKLNHKRQEGIYVDPLIKEKLVGTVSSTLSKMYICTNNERNVLEILLILCEDDYINISYFESLFNVSRNTIIGDIKEIRKMIGTYNLTLDYNTTSGYIIAGLPIRKRSVILNLISNYDYLIKIKSFGLYTDEVVKQSFELLTSLERELNIRYVNTTLHYLSVLIGIIKTHHLEPITLPEEDRKIVEKSQEYKAVVNISGGFLEETEYIYLALHLLGLRIHVAEEYELQEDDYVSEIVEFLISEFSKITLIYFDDDRDLFAHLYTHMKQAMFRLKYGIIYQNELKDQILKTYPQVSHVTRTICNKLEKKIGYPIGDDDVTFIAMHFGGYLVREERDIFQIKVLLVCLNGIATSKLLSKELEYLIGNIEIIDAVSLDEVYEYKDEVDYIISTIPIKDSSVKDKTLIVNPILTDLDKSKIVSFMGLTYPSKSEYGLSEKIVQDIIEYIPKDKVGEVRKIILSRISGKKDKNLIIEGKKHVMLIDLLIEEHIAFLNSVASWQEAIKLSAQPLLDANLIEQKYIDKVISNVNELGPYIVIAPNIAISHARPQDGVNGLGMTMLILDEAVYFSKDLERPVRIIITLSAPDNEQHLLALQQLSRLLMEDLDRLLEATDAKTVIELVRKYSNSREI